MREFSAIWVVFTLILPLNGCDGNPALTQFNKGEQLLTRGDMDTAISCFSRAIELKPDYVAAYSQRGFAYAYQCKYDDAITDFSEAIRLDPSNGKAYGRRGGAYRHKGEYDKAIEDFTEVIRLEPEAPGGFALRALAYRQIGDQAKADADLAKMETLKAKK